jgi:hypothetical protein
MSVFSDSTSSGGAKTPAPAVRLDVLAIGGRVRLRGMPECEAQRIRALARAMLLLALRDLAGPSPTLRASAQRWITTPRALLTFADVCDALGLDPAAVRARLVGPCEGTIRGDHASRTVARGA